jgi:hypothetical protein
VTNKVFVGEDDIGVYENQPVQLAPTFPHVNLDDLRLEEIASHPVLDPPGMLPDVRSRHAPAVSDLHRAVAPAAMTSRAAMERRLREQHADALQHLEEEVRLLLRAKQQ